ncbi:hypothetical protein [Salinarimonas rosea]|uniref:hypothetical protein n=1 Tax=Salinarimonas rosea TaxID=552063 RepID=UPI000418AD1A|nr:hypothetical protein [Salinarimonas rosea]
MRASDNFRLHLPLDLARTAWVVGPTTAGGTELLSPLAVRCTWAILALLRGADGEVPYDDLAAVLRVTTKSARRAAIECAGAHLSAPGTDLDRAKVFTLLVPLSGYQATVRGGVKVEVSYRASRAFGGGVLPIRPADYARVTTQPGVQLYVRGMALTHGGEAAKIVVDEANVVGVFGPLVGTARHLARVASDVVVRGVRDIAGAEDLLARHTRLKARSGATKVSLRLERTEPVDETPQLELDVRPIEGGLAGIPKPYIVAR